MSTLDKLVTDHGDVSTYDAASQCSRCGYCEQACPTYVTTGREAFSPRGRNQIVRLMLEGKLTDAESAQKALSSCLLCGACTSSCYTHVRTADLVLEGRRKLAGEKIPWIARLLTGLLENRPKLFAGLLKLSFSIKRLGLPRIASCLGLFRILGMQGIAAADEHVDHLPRKFLFELLNDGGASRSTEAGWRYFAPCGPNYLFPDVGLASISALERTGPGAPLNNACCGLLAYNYGSLDAARRMAKRNIEIAERDGSAAGDSQIVGDCSSCVAHLKSYPQLFLDDAEWKRRAQAFSGRVRDALEVLGPKENTRGIRTGDGAVTYHDSCRARNGEGIVSRPREAMLRLFGDRYVELPEANWCCGGAGAFAFTQPELSEEVLRHKIATIASIQARLVVTSSTSCLIQLARGFKKYYPDCRVVHFSEVVSDRIGAYSRPKNLWGDDKT